MLSKDLSENTSTTLMVKEEKNGVSHRRKLNFCWSKLWFLNDRLWYSHCGHEVMLLDPSEVLMKSSFSNHTSPLYSWAQSYSYDLKKKNQALSLPAPIETNGVIQPFSTSVPQESLKYARPDYLVRDTDLFSLRLSMKKWKQPTQQSSSVNESKLYLFFCQVSEIYNIVFGVLQNFCN